jgi:hypothetical protein
LVAAKAEGAILGKAEKRKKARKRTRSRYRKAWAAKMAG